jgi:hypothetical protein
VLANAGIVPEDPRIKAAVLVSPGFAFSFVQLPYGVSLSKSNYGVVVMIASFLSAATSVSCSVILPGL